MLSEEISKQISEATEEMTKEEFYVFLQDLENEGKIKIHCAEIDTIRGFAEHLVNRMKEALDNGEWYGYETKALRCLDSICGKEYDLIKIDPYGFLQILKATMTFCISWGLVSILRKNLNLSRFMDHLFRLLLGFSIKFIFTSIVFWYLTSRRFSIACITALMKLPHAGLRRQIVFMNIKMARLLTNTEL